VLDTSDNAHSASDNVDPAGERAVPLFYFMDAGSPEAAHWAGLLQLEGLPVLIQEAESRLQPAQFACTADDGDHLSEEQRSGMAAHPYASLYANRPLALTAVQMRLQIAQLLSADGICRASLLFSTHFLVCLCLICWLCLVQRPVTSRPSWRCALNCANSVSLSSPPHTPVSLPPLMPVFRTLFAFHSSHL
jgi:hypothetical protein